MTTLVLNGWDNATKKQRAHELLNNVHPDVALALVTDGAKEMDTNAAFALMATLPQPRQKLVLQQLEVARRSATDGEPWAEFASKLHHNIVCSRGHSTSVVIRLWPPPGQCSLLFLSVTSGVCH